MRYASRCCTKSGIISASTRTSSNTWDTTSWPRRAAWLISLALAGAAYGQATQPAPSTQRYDAGVEAEARRLIARGAEYLLSAQEADGGWSAEHGPGVSALVLRALTLTPNVGPEHPAVRRGVELVLKSQRDDGGVYAAGGGHKNYETSVVVSMLSALKGADYADKVSAARKFLIENQWDEGEGKSPEDAYYGGAGYGAHKRPDLSNTQFMLDALRDSGLPPSDPAYQKALVFISRCQMLGEHNDQPFAKGSTQGGFIYTAADGGSSKAGEIEIDGRKALRCYGSMTYAGFKSMVYAGLTPDDPRVKAAIDWIGRNWTLDHNPNMPSAQSREGLYYYYHTFGRALAAWGENLIRDHRGQNHDWRRELVEKLRALQRPDGSWVNDEDRWMEGLPALTTAYAVLALEAAYPFDR